MSANMKQALHGLLLTLALSLTAAGAAHAVNVAGFVSHTIPANMVPGQPYTITVTMQNTGTTTWTAAGNYKLASIASGSNGAPARVVVPSSVAPAQNVVFSFNMTAPAAAGIYNFQHRMIQDGVEWIWESTPMPVFQVKVGIPDATFVSQEVLPGMIPGTTYPVRVTMQNTGGTVWSPGSISLGSQNPQDNTTWGLSRVALPQSVAPGASVDFNFNATAPATTGTHNFQWRIVQGASTWIGQASTNVAVPVAPDDAAFVSQSVPAIMVPGQTYSVSVTLQNTGASTWSPSAHHRLGSQNPQDNILWGLSRVELPGPVAPGATVTIPFTIVAPAAGVHNFQWRMLHETAWFGAVTQNAPVTVGTPLAGMHFIHVDHLNTPREVYDASAQLRWTWDQAEPFGVNVPDENPSSLGVFEFALRFPGQYFDKETNLAYNWSRDFDSTVGRYIQSDPIGMFGGINTYGYVFGQPLTRADPKGLGPELAIPIAIAISVVAVAASSTVTKPKNLPAKQESLWDRLCANADDPCAEIQAEIQKTIDKMRNLRATMLSDPRNLFSAARTVPNPAETGTSTTWQNHVTNYENERAKLAELIALATKIPCPIPPEALVEVNIPAPASPRLAAK